jgi:peptide deformylase
MVAQMIETMDTECGIGLAANQVGWNVNLMVIDTRHYNEDEDGEYHIIANAEILSSEGESIMEEGCLSIPDIRAEIKRPETILLKYQDMKQNIHEKYFSGLVSRLIKH